MTIATKFLQVVFLHASAVQTALALRAINTPEPGEQAAAAKHQRAAEHDDDVAPTQGKVQKSNKQGLDFPYPKYAIYNKR